MPLPSTGPQSVFGTRVLCHFGTAVSSQAALRCSRVLLWLQSPTLIELQLPCEKRTGTPGYIFRFVVCGVDAARSVRENGHSGGERARVPPSRRAGRGRARGGAAGEAPGPSLGAGARPAAFGRGRCCGQCCAEPGAGHRGHRPAECRRGEAPLCLHGLYADRISCDPRNRSSCSHHGGQGLSFLPFCQEGKLCLGSADSDQPG